jgi:hypothetical protein
MFQALSGLPLELIRIGPLLLSLIQAIITRKKFQTPREQRRFGIISKLFWSFEFS